MGCGHYAKDETRTRKSKFAVQIGQCASMEEVTGVLSVEESNGNFSLSVMPHSAFKRNHLLHEFIPRSLINKTVRIRWDGKSIVIEERE